MVFVLPRAYMRSLKIRRITAFIRFASLIPRHLHGVSLFPARQLVKLLPFIGLECLDGYT